MVYYNEIDPFAAAWLRQLIEAGHIAPGDVDERDIRDVTPNDVRGYTQCHWFAGIGVWSYALRCAGWPDDRPVWTGSCPCQPFSVAGQTKGFNDERHLWPDWFRLIRECRPGLIIGEQVASKDALSWLDLVQDDMEDAGYAVGAADLCAAGVGAPHIRQRLYFVADTCRERIRAPERRADRVASSRVQRADGQREWLRLDAGTGGAGSSGELADSPSERRNGREAPSGEDGWGVFEVGGIVGNPSSTRLARRSRQSEDDGEEQSAVERTGGAVGGMDDADRFRRDRRQRAEEGCVDDGADARRFQSDDGLGSAGQVGSLAGFWRDADWLYCRDGKYRPAQPGTFPLAHGASARVGRLRGYGNCIVAPLATEFIQAVIDVLRQDSDSVTQGENIHGT